MRTGLADVRTAVPSDDMWKAIAAELGLPADAAATAGLAQAPDRPLGRLLHRLGYGRSIPAGTLARFASAGAIAAAVFVVGLSLDVVLSGQAANGFAWTTSGLHQLGVPLDEAGIQPSPQNRAPADMSAARAWPDRGMAAADEATATGHPSRLALASSFGRTPARVVVPR